MSEATPVDIGQAAVEDLAFRCGLQSSVLFGLEASKTLLALRTALTAAESRVRELEVESAKHYYMAVAMFFSGKVDEVTAADCRVAADKIKAKLEESNGA